MVRLYFVTVLDSCCPWWIAHLGDGVAPEVAHERGEIVSKHHQKRLCGRGLHLRHRVHGARGSVPLPADARQHRVRAQQRLRGQETNEPEPFTNVCVTLSLRAAVGRCSPAESWGLAAPTRGQLNNVKASPRRQYH